MLSAPDALIGFRGVRKEYPGGSGRPGTVAVTDLDLDVRAGELLTLVGPSGCGKSTTLRMVNRLVEPSAGTITVRGQDIMSMDPVQLRRGIGYVIQHVGLFPHRTVAQNVATVPGLLRWDRRRTRDRVAELLALVGLDPGTYGKRFPHELSGGERQRVGVARALVSDPPVLLMDEPFGAVDPQGRRNLQEEFRRIQRALGTTVMLVTHDIEEAVSLGDRVAVFSVGGVLEQVGEPVSILASPANDTVAQFLGTGRSVRLLAVGTLGRADLGQDLSPTSGTGGSQNSDRARIRLGVTLEDALSATIADPRGAVLVEDEHGEVVGQVTSADVVRALHRLNASAA